MTEEYANNSSGWTGQYLDFLDGNHLVCATEGKGNPEYEPLCLFVRFGLGAWFWLLTIACTIIFIKVSNIRKKLKSITAIRTPDDNKKSKVVTRMSEIGHQVEVALVAMLFFSGLMMITGGLGIVYPPNQPLGILGDCAMASCYASVGQVVFWSRQYALQTRYLIPKHRGAHVENEDRKCTFSSAVNVVEHKLTPCAYTMMAVLLASGVISRYQFWTVIMTTCVLWGFSLIHALLFTRLASISSIIRIHNNVGGEQGAVQRRQITMWRMVLSLVADLISVFISAVAHPLTILVFSIHESSTRSLILNSVAVSLNLVTFTAITVIRLKILKAKQIALQCATTEVKKRADRSSFATSAMLDVPTANVYQSSTF